MSARCHACLRKVAGRHVEVQIGSSFDNPRNRKYPLRLTLWHLSCAEEAGVMPDQVPQFGKWPRGFTAGPVQTLLAALRRPGQDDGQQDDGDDDDQAPQQVDGPVSEGPTSHG